jgi:hypothetical protein
VTALYEPALPGTPLPRAALDALNQWMWQLDDIVIPDARVWGGGDGVSFWVVPVVPDGAGPCAPATRLCVVAVPEDRRVTVVGAGGDAGAVHDRLVDAGYEVSSAAPPEIVRQERTAVYWDQRDVTRETTARVATIAGADDRFEIGGQRPSRPR